MDTKPITPRRFHEAAGVEDWRVLGEGACAQVSIDALVSAEVMPFWRAVLGYEYRADSPDEDLVDPRDRGPSIWFQRMDAPRPQRNRMHIDVWVPHDQAEARVAAAIAAGGRLVTDEHAPMWWVLADPEGNEVDVATWVSRD
jgi:4a-hydroxytetrahydrobiopterin dehydratase